MQTIEILIVLNFLNRIKIFIYDLNVHTETCRHFHYFS